MSYLEQCLQKFYELPEEIKDYLNSDSVIKSLEKIEEEFKIDLTFPLILVFIDELKLSDLSLYLEKRYQAEISVINKVLFKLEEEILGGAIQIISEIGKEGEDYLLDLNPQEKKVIITEVFTEKIIPQFTLPEEHLLRLNAVIFELIGRDESFWNQLNKLFLNNKELISKNKIDLKGRQEDPSIANWIRDFISENGSDIFSPVVLAKYLSSSKNVVKLDDPEKQILRQILKIYKNLIFFPDSMVNVPHIDWEIFPINRDLLKIYNKNLKTREIKTEERKNPSLEKKSSEKPKVEKRDKLAEKKPPLKKLSSKKKDESEVLEDLLKKYPQKSLERKAVESELKKTKKKLEK